MNTVEEKVYTTADEALSIASKLYDNLSNIRYDPVGATELDVARSENLCCLLKNALEISNIIRSNTGKG